MKEADAKVATPATSEAGSSRGKPTHRQVTELLRKAAKKMGTKGDAVQDIEKLVCRLEIHVMLESILTAETIEDLENQETAFKDAVGMSKQLLESAKKAAMTLQSHIQNKHRTAARVVATAAKSAAREETKRHQKATRELAQQLSSKEKEMPPIFQLAFNQLIEEDILGRVVIADGQPQTPPDPTNPILIKNPPAAAKWQHHGVVQLAFGNYGGLYKKSEHMNDHGTTQSPMYKKDGAAETETFFSDTCKMFLPGCVLNESVVEEQFARVLKMAWFFGYDPAFQRVKHLPNGLAQFKFLCNGEIACLLFEVRSLVPALRTWLKKDTFGIDEVEQLIASFGRDELAELKRHSCRMIALTLAPEQLLYIPTGWILAERVVKGNLIYGCRKTLLTASVESIANYEELIGLHVGAKKGVTKLQGVLEFMKQST